MDALISVYVNSLKCSNSMPSIDTDIFPPWVIHSPYDHILVELFEKLEQATDMDPRASNG